MVIAEVDDMAMLRLVAREADALALVPPVVVRDELAAKTLVERCKVPGIHERFYAIVPERRFPDPRVAALLRGATATSPPGSGSGPDPASAHSTSSRDRRGRAGSPTQAYSARGPRQPRPGERL